MATPVCPRDGTTLTSTPDVLGPKTKAHVCGTCAGVLVDWSTAEQFFGSLGLSLGDLQTMVRHAAARPRKTAPLPCTACGQANLNPLVHKGLELDLCEACGTTWFDRGELQRISGGRLGKQVATEAAPAGEVVGVYEMWWDCAHCDTKGLLGRANRFCPHCGAQQDAAARYFPPAGSETSANHEYDGADLACPACNTPNGARAHNCRNCGSPLDGAQQVGRAADQAQTAPPPRTVAAPGAPTAGKKSSVWKWVAIAGGLIGVLLLFCCLSALWTKDQAVTVVAHEWERTVDIERFSAVSDSAWCSSMPSGAYSITRKRERSGTNKVPDGQTCTTRNVDRGDGTFERREECRTKYRDEPEYDEKCYFTIDRWAHARTAKLNDTGLTPLWPTAGALRGGTGLGAEREGKRGETYRLRLQGADGKAYDCALPEAKWAQVPDGLKKQIPITVIGDVPECDKL